MRLSEAIRLGSLAIQNPQKHNSDFCALGMAVAAIGRTSGTGTTMLTNEDPNCRVIAEMWPWAADKPWEMTDGRIAYTASYLGLIARLFDYEIMEAEEMTIEQLCDRVAGWERELAAKGINVEQVTMAATPETPSEPAAEHTEKVSQ